MGTGDQRPGEDPEADRPQRRQPSQRPREDPGRAAGEGTPGEDGQVAEPLAVERAPFTQQLGRALLVALAVLFGVFAVANSHYVDFSWVFGGTEVVTDAQGERVRGGVPLILLLVASFLAGGVLAWAITVQTARARRARERRTERDRKRGRP